jgi:aryl-phospho-beta-D-glucosidase BglC (GH1 family)
MRNLICLFLLSLVIQQGVLAQGTSKSLPDPDALAKEHPSPAVVRGFMVGSFGQKDAQDLKAWGANVIRLQFSPASFAYRMNKDIWEAWPELLNQLETKVRIARDNGLKVVLDLHQPPFQNVKSFDYAEFWSRTDLEGPFCKLWTDVAKRFQPYKESIWGYDILNEPLDRTQLPGVTKEWRPLAIKIIEAIRKVDPDTWIVFEPGPGSLFSGFKDLEPLPDKHVIYSAHFYTPQDFTHQGVFNIKVTDLAKAMEKINLNYPSDTKRWNRQALEKTLKDADEFQAKWKVPIYVGEFSVIRWAPKEAATNWLKDVIDMVESRGWSWSYHAFREFHGWSLEHDEQFWREGMPSPQPITYETERAKIIKTTLLKNNSK